jgi:hypothetical protein
MTTINLLPACVFGGKTLQIQKTQLLSPHPTISTPSCGHPTNPSNLENTCQQKNTLSPSLLEMAAGSMATVAEFYLH